MTVWPVVTVERLCARVTSGGTPSRSKPKFYEPGKHLWVKSKELVDRSISDTEELISDAGLKGSSAKPIQPNTVLMAMYGANVGQLGWLLVPATVNQAICAMETDPEVTNGRWLFYSLMYFRPALTAKAHGAAQQNLSQGLIREFGIPTPPLCVQRKIAAVLAAYDELIENNLRRIKILEEMAQAVYREWFVNFRFPGHENVAMVDSPLGPIPEGWEASVVSEAFDILGGATPSTKRPEFWDGGTINWYTPSDLTGHGQMFIETSVRQITPEGLANCSASLFPAGSVMMTSRATLGVVAINLEPACTNQGFITCLPNERVSATHLYFWIRSSLPLIESLASGATFKEITKRAFRQIEFLIPTNDVRRAFVGIVEPVFLLITNLVRQNANLRSSRDLLLPKLVSGDIDVSDLDIDSEWLSP